MAEFTLTSTRDPRSSYRRRWLGSLIFVTLLWLALSVAFSHAVWYDTLVFLVLRPAQLWLAIAYAYERGRRAQFWIDQDAAFDAFRVTKPWAKDD